MWMSEVTAHPMYSLPKHDSSVTLDAKVDVCATEGRGRGS
jgi:hypothetical protein